MRIALTFLFSVYYVINDGVLVFGCRLASVFSELARLYYKEEGRRVKQRIDKKNVSSVELIVRYCFKVRILFFFFLFPPRICWI